MNPITKLLNLISQKSILLRNPRMDNSNYDEALEFLTSRETNKALREASKELTDLERQLAEAREELGKEIKKAQDFEFAYKHTYDLKCYWEMQYNKLKEKGDE